MQLSQELLAVLHGRIVRLVIAEPPIIGVSGPGDFARSTRIVTAAGADDSARQGKQAAQPSRTHEIFMPSIHLRIIGHHPGLIMQNRLSCLTSRARHKIIMPMSIRPNEGMPAGALPMLILRVLHSELPPRLRHRPAHSPSLQRSPRRRRRPALPHAAEDASQRLGHRRMGHLRNQSQSPLLSSDACGPRAS